MSVRVRYDPRRRCHYVDPAPVQSTPPRVSSPSRRGSASAHSEPAYKHLTSTVTRSGSRTPLKPGRGYAEGATQKLTPRSSLGRTTYAELASTLRSTPSKMATNRLRGAALPPHASSSSNHATPERSRSTKSLLNSTVTPPQISARRQWHAAQVAALNRRIDQTAKSTPLVVPSTDYNEYLLVETHKTIFGDGSRRGVGNTSAPAGYSGYSNRMAVRDETPIHVLAAGGDPKQRTAKEKADEALTVHSPPPLKSLVEEALDDAALTALIEEEMRRSAEALRSEAVVSSSPRSRYSPVKEDTRRHKESAPGRPPLRPHTSYIDANDDEEDEDLDEYDRRLLEAARRRAARDTARRGHPTPGPGDYERPRSDFSPKKRR